MSKKSTIDLDDWYDAEQAAERLSKNSGRTIDKAYPRTLARYGKIKSLDIGARGKLYLKADVDAYRVDSKRGPKPKVEREAA